MSFTDWADCLKSVQRLRRAVQWSSVWLELRARAVLTLLPWLAPSRNTAWECSTPGPPPAPQRRAGFAGAAGLPFPFVLQRLITESTLISLKKLIPSEGCWSCRLWTWKSSWDKRLPNTQCYNSMAAGAWSCSWIPDLCSIHFQAESPGGVLIVLREMETLVWTIMSRRLLYSVMAERDSAKQSTPVFTTVVEICFILLKTIDVSSFLKENVCSVEKSVTARILSFLYSFV